MRLCHDVVVSTLGRVLDPDALDACLGARACLRVDVPAAWLADGGSLELTSPVRLACARCDGGGCDSCARSGVLRAPVDAAARTLRVSLPGASPPAVALRIPAPFGPEHDIVQLILVLREAPQPSTWVRRTSPPSAPTVPRDRLPWPAIGVGMVVLAMILVVLLGR